MNAYTLGSDDPDYPTTWVDGNGNVIDFSAGDWTYEVRLGFPGREAEFSKTTGITGAATAPNITITWAPGDLDDLTPGTRLLQIFPTRAGRTRSPLTELFTLNAAVAAVA